MNEVDEKTDLQYLSERVAIASDQQSFAVINYSQKMGRLRIDGPKLECAFYMLVG